MEGLGIFSNLNQKLTQGFGETEWLFWGRKFGINKIIFISKKEAKILTNIGWRVLLIYTSSIIIYYWTYLAI